MVSFDENQIILDTDMGLLDSERQKPACEPADAGKKKGRLT